MSTQQATIVLGDEYDDVLRDALCTVLRENHATGVPPTWGVGGSQELETLRVTLDEQLVIVEAETFIGLSLIGPKSVIEEIARQVNKYYSGTRFSMG